VVREATVESRIYPLFAELLSYPTENTAVAARECVKALRALPQYPKDAADGVEKFAREIEKLPLDDLQGIFSYTFELTGEYTLDLGFHLFDGFKRTGTLVAMKEMYKTHGFYYDEVAKGELADNLCVVLKFLAELEDQGLKKEFRESFLIRALEKLWKNFESNKKNVYYGTLAALISVINADVKNA
jgi:nitrate reductase assembly molybdenum cofactor insertion protein NarJ